MRGCPPDARPWAAGGSLLGYSWSYGLERAMPRAEFDDLGRLVCCCSAGPATPWSLFGGGSLPQRLR